MIDRGTLIRLVNKLGGAYRPPLTVTELFDDPKKIDVRLTGCSLRVNKKHIELEQ